MFRSNLSNSVPYALNKLSINEPNSRDSADTMNDSDDDSPISVDGPNEQLNDQSNNQMSATAAQTQPLESSGSADEPINLSTSQSRNQPPNSSPADSVRSISQSLNQSFVNPPANQPKQSHNSASVSQSMTRSLETCRQKRRRADLNQRFQELKQSLELGDRSVKSTVLAEACSELEALRRRNLELSTYINQSLNQSASKLDANGKSIVNPLNLPSGIQSTNQSMSEVEVLRIRNFELSSALASAHAELSKYRAMHQPVTQVINQPTNKPVNNQLFYSPASHTVGHAFHPFHAPNDRPSNQTKNLMVPTYPAQPVTHVNQFVQPLNNQSVNQHQPRPFLGQSHVVVQSVVALTPDSIRLPNNQFAQPSIEISNQRSVNQSSNQLMLRRINSAPSFDKFKKKPNKQQFNKQLISHSIEETSSLDDSDDSPESPSPKRSVKLSDTRSNNQSNNQSPLPPVHPRTISTAAQSPSLVVKDSATTQTPNALLTLSRAVQLETLDPVKSNQLKKLMKMEEYYRSLTQSSDESSDQPGIQSISPPVNRSEPVKDSTVNNQSVNRLTTQPISSMKPRMSHSMSAHSLMSLAMVE